MVHTDADRQCTRYAMDAQRRFNGCEGYSRFTVEIPAVTQFENSHYPVYFPRLGSGYTKQLTVGLAVVNTVMNTEKLQKTGSSLTG